MRAWIEADQSMSVGHGLTKPQGMMLFDRVEKVVSVINPEMRPKKGHHSGAIGRRMGRAVARAGTVQADMFNGLIARVGLPAIGA